ncbi:Dam family site-specific DNA-(adenine-N6)-methyltransferase [Methanospirillum purgamenti]|uniref:Dam family site-specific DNA-(Adenine-N6)-methyltransferase n=1 Tax=Methanospirillum hungatei TaxID=2203 RepID=A0A8F5VPZ9_METHU|nr:Dam family site-specific DNA-(adenine-N6)-methyltransferase [Methanospirillum hungatei]QXO95570.1 Dam family site-specific DNA-(adenine-N6)-methyltransferase [Methanospirillum hungatei]
MICHINNSSKNLSILRYPGGKQRFIQNFSHLFPHNLNDIQYYVEPFLGGGAVFFHLNPKRAVLSDINSELIDLYQGIRKDPKVVWKLYCSYPDNKDGYYEIRNMNPEDLHLLERAARILYLNRTCFKGMWRYNTNGEFNVGYGGQDRRWVIDQKDLIDVAKRLKKADLKCSDFNAIIDESVDGDFLFLDPPYCPGQKEQLNEHYRYGIFAYPDQKRLANALKRATKRGVQWVMTNSSHPDIVKLYKKNRMFQPDIGTGSNPGQLSTNPGEVIIFSIKEEMF